MSAVGDAQASTLPHLLQVLVVVVLVGTVFAAGIAAYWPRREDRDDSARPAHRHARPSADKREDKRLSSAAPDKPPYQPPTPGFPPTAGMRAISKLPGQDRLTRDPAVLRDAQQPTISAVPDDRSSGDTPTLAQQGPPPLRRIDPPLAQHPPTSEMPTVLPPLPPIRPRTGPAAAAGPHQPVQPRETRQQRRERMERLALDEAARLRRDRPPESPQELGQDG